MASDWQASYGSWASTQGLGAKVGNFIQGAATFLEALGIERGLGASFISLIVVSYALTSLDSATRLLRYNLEEMAASWRFLRRVFCMPKSTPGSSGMRKTVPAETHQPPLAPLAPPPTIEKPGVLLHPANATTAVKTRPRNRELIRFMMAMSP